MSSLVHWSTMSLDFVKLSRLLQPNLLSNRHSMTLNILCSYDRLSLHLINHILYELAPLHFLVAIDIDLLK